MFFEVVHTTGWDKSPKMSHRSAMTLNPTKMTTKRPTNLTDTEPVSMTPTVDSQNHQLSEKARSRWLWNLTVAYTEPEMKNNRSGSSRMKRFSVSMP